MSDIFDDEVNESGTFESPDPMNDPNPMGFEDPSPTPAASEEVEPESEPYEAPENANVKLSTGQESKALNEGITNIGKVSIDMPNKEAQLGGFYLPDEQVSTLVGQFPQYKFLVKKGTSAPAVRI